MVSSMTGFGRGRAAQDGREMTVELKSVNHRYLDLSFRMPRHISFAEDTLRTALNDSLSRGHVDVYVNYRNTRSDAKEVRIDTALLGAYLKSVKAAARTYRRCSTRRQAARSRTARSRSSSHRRRALTRSSVRRRRTFPRASCPRASSNRTLKAPSSSCLPHTALM